MCGDEGDIRICVRVTAFRFIVIVIIRLATHVLQLFLAPSTMAQTFSLDRLDINHQERETLFLVSIFVPIITSNKKVISTV